MDKNLSFMLCNGALNISQIYTKWYEYASKQNCGALLSFCGIVRKEDDIEALSFEIFEPLLNKWFKKWQEKARQKEAQIFFAHSLGDVKIYESSYLAAVLSKKRKLGLSLINEFVEDFKANAPIWKYDVKFGKKIYAKERSVPLKGAGILS